MRGLGCISVVIQILAPFMQMAYLVIFLDLVIKVWLFLAVHQMTNDLIICSITCFHGVFRNIWRVSIQQTFLKSLLKFHFLSIAINTRDFFKQFYWYCSTFYICITTLSTLQSLKETKGKHWKNIKWHRCTQAQNHWTFRYRVYYISTKIN